MQPKHVGGVLLASFLLMAGCKDEVTRPCDLWTASAVVSGHVTNSSGAGIGGAAVVVQVALQGQCDGAKDWAQSKQVLTDAHGDYSAKVDLGNFRGIRCVSATELASGTSARGQVEFVGGCDETRPPGQVRIDLVTP